MLSKTAILAFLVKNALAFPAGPNCNAIDNVVQQARVSPEVSAFCSSYLSIPTQTVTVSQTATATADAATVTTTVATVTNTETDTVTTTSTAVVLRRDGNGSPAWAGPHPTPALFATAQASMISSACECLGLPTPTVTVSATATVTDTPTVTALATATAVSTVLTTTTSVYSPAPYGYILQVTAGPGTGQYLYSKNANSATFVGYTTDMASADVFNFVGGTVTDVSTGQQLYYYSGAPVNYVVASATQPNGDLVLQCSLDGNGNVDCNQSPLQGGTGNVALCGGSLVIITPENNSNGYGCYLQTIHAIPYTG